MGRNECHGSTLDPTAAHHSVRDGRLTFHLQLTGCLLPVNHEAVLALVLFGYVLDCEVLAPTAGCDGVFAIGL